MVSVQVHYVRPSPCDDVAAETDSVLTEECRIQTNLPEDAIRNAQPLELVVDEVSRSVSQSVGTAASTRRRCRLF